METLEGAWKRADDAWKRADDACKRADDAWADARKLVKTLTVRAYPAGPRSSYPARPRLR